MKSLVKIIDQYQTERWSSYVQVTQLCLLNAKQRLDLRKHLAFFAIFFIKILDGLV